MRNLFLVVVVCGWVCAGPDPQAATYYVALDGDIGNDGSEAQPWPSVHHAVRQVQGGDTIVVKDGEYHGYTSVHLEFDDWVTVRAEHPHRAVLTNPYGETEVILLLGARRVILEDLVFTNEDPDHVCNEVGNNWAVHIQNSQDVIFRNNIVYKNRAVRACNNLFAVNRGADTEYPRNIQVTGNVFYDAPDIEGANLMYFNGVGEIDVTENIFFSRNSHLADSFISLYRQARPEDAGVEPRSPRLVFARNIFLNWDGAPNTGFLRIGKSWETAQTVRDVLVENNLVIGNAQLQTVAPFQVRSVMGLNLRANTITGDLPGAAYAMNLYYEGIDVTKQDIFIRNNIWSDPTGTMGERFLEYRTDVIDPLAVNIVLDHNLYHNAGNQLPLLQVPAPGADVNAVVADPLLTGDQSGLVLPVWDAVNRRFMSGSTTIREEFERLVYAYGAIGEQSPAIGAADPANMPADDILGRQRDSDPDLGAFEFIAPQPDGGSQDGGDTPSGRVVLRAGESIPSGRVVTPDGSQVVLRLELESHHASGRLTTLPVRLPGLEQADNLWSRLQLLLYTDPEGDGLVGSSSVLAGGAWVQEGQALVQLGDLRFEPEGTRFLLLQLGVSRTAARKAGIGSGLWLLLLALLWWLLRGRPGLRLALTLGIVLILCACTRYGFKPTIFDARLVIDGSDDVTVSPEFPVQLDPDPIQGAVFKVSL